MNLVVRGVALFLSRKQNNFEYKFSVAEIKYEDSKLLLRLF